MCVYIYIYIYTHKNSEVHSGLVQKIQKASIKTYEEDVNIYKDIENSQGQFFFLKAPVYIYIYIYTHIHVCMCMCTWIDF